MPVQFMSFCSLNSAYVGHDLKNTLHELLNLESSHVQVDATKKPDSRWVSFMQHRHPLWLRSVQFRLMSPCWDHPNQLGCLCHHLWCNSDVVVHHRHSHDFGACALRHAPVVVCKKISYNR